LGNLFFLLVSSSDPFDEVSFFSFDTIPGNMVLYLTDEAWNGTHFQNNEGTLKFTTPPEGIAAGVAFGMGPDTGGAYQYGSDWMIEYGVFALATEGEQVFLYCLSADQTPRPLTAISYNGPFQPPGLPEYAFNESALPDELSIYNASIVLPHEHRWYYNGPKFLETSELKAAIQDTNNWVGTSGASRSANGITTATTSLLLGGLFWAWTSGMAFS
jgi:hypothetical protein